MPPHWKRAWNHWWTWNDQRNKFVCVHFRRLLETFHLTAIWPLSIWKKKPTKIIIADLPCWGSIVLLFSVFFFSFLQRVIRKLPLRRRMTFRTSRHKVAVRVRKFDVQKGYEAGFRSVLWLLSSSNVYVASTPPFSLLDTGRPLIYISSKRNCVWTGHIYLWAVYIQDAHCPSLFQPYNIGNLLGSQYDFHSEDAIQH